jgi:hypothetical protein
MILAGELIIVYDLQAPDAWGEACCHNRMWGRLYTSLYSLDANHIALVFRPAPDRRWRDWEQVRLEWLQEQVA